MSVNGNKFSSLTLVQLNELLDDDEKLSNMIQEMDEVRISVLFEGTTNIITPAGRGREGLGGLIEFQRSILCTEKKFTRDNGDISEFI